MGPVCWEGVREYSVARRSSSRAGAAGEAPPRSHTGPRYLLRPPKPQVFISESLAVAGGPLCQYRNAVRPRKVTHDDQLDVVVGSPHYSSHSQCPSENDSPSCPSISASFSLNLNSSVASETRLESTLCVAPRLRPNFSDSVTSLLIASLVQLSPVAPTS